MDLTQLNVSDAGSSDMVLRHPATGEDLDITIKLLGKDSAEYRKAVSKVGNSRINQRKKVTVEQTQQDALDLLVAVTVGWAGMTENGEELEFSPENAKRVYRDYPWIKEQADEFVHDRANFMMIA